MRFMLVDLDSGAANAAIDWRFTREGDRVKVRVTEMDSDHPNAPSVSTCTGPYGRCLVLARDGTAEPKPGWKDRSWYHGQKNHRLCSTRVPPHREPGRDGSLPHRRAPAKRMISLQFTVGPQGSIPKVTAPR